MTDGSKIRPRGNDMKEETLEMENNNEEIMEMEELVEEPIKRNKRKIIIAIILVLFVLLVGYRVATNILGDDDTEESVPVNVKVMTAEVGEIYVESPITAKIEASNMEPVVPLVAGKVTKVYYQEGDHVKKGAVLFKIDDTQAQASVLQAAGAVQQADAGIAQLNETLSSTEAALESARTAFERTQVLYDEEIISQQDYESAQVQLTTAESQYNALKAQYSSSLSSRSTAQSAYDIAKKSLSYYEVTAPISGYLTSFSVRAGGVAGQSAMGYISDISSLEINTTVTESMAGRINEGDEVDVYIGTLDRTVQGKVKTFTKIPNPGTVTYPITISIENPKNDILAGMFAEVKVKSQRNENALLIPSDAVILKNGETTVITLDGKMPVVNVVETGIDNGTQVEIVSGIKAGDKVVVSGQQYVKEGEEVNIID